jgi:hypothetical protein
MNHLQGILYAGRPDVYIGLPLIFLLKSTPNNYVYCFLSVFGIIAGNSLNNYVDYKDDIKQTVTGNRKHYYFEQYCKQCHYLWAYWISTLWYACIISTCLVPYTYKWGLAIVHYTAVVIYNLQVRQYKHLKMMYTANYFAMSFLFFDIVLIDYLCLLMYFLRTETLYDDIESRHKHMAYRYYGLTILILAVHGIHGQWAFAVSNLLFAWIYAYSAEVDTRLYKSQLISYLILF